MAFLNSTIKKHLEKSESKFFPENSKKEKNVMKFSAFSSMTHPAA
jgi:hypothetical protein